VNGKVYDGQLAICIFLLEQSKSPLLGKNDLDRAIVYERANDAVYAWKQQFAQNREETLLVDSFNQKLNSELSGKTFLASNYFTFSDIALYSTLYSTAIAGAAKDIMHIVRYYEMVQHKLRKMLPSLDLRVDEYDIQVPIVEMKQEEKPKKTAEKAGKDAKKEKSDKPAKAEKGDKSVKSDKSEKPAKASKPADSKDEKASALPDPSKLDIRVGHIKSVVKHPDAESLYVEEVDVGEEAPRTVVSGLVKHISIEEFTGKQVLLLCNLKPAKMRGIESQAMVLCATSADGNTVELVQPPAGSKPGDIATFEGFQGSSAN
jgi:aminoacyl tRNA synthase complex-interacting multifunctional protein 1